jgi:hypothetical protein
MKKSIIQALWLNTQRLSIKLYDAYEVEGTIHTCLVCVNLFFSQVLVFQTKPLKKKTPSCVVGWNVVEWNPWWNEDLLDEKGSVQLKVEGDKGEDSWCFYLFFSFYECVWLFDASNRVERICGEYCE